MDQPALKKRANQLRTPIRRLIMSIATIGLLAAAALVMATPFDRKPTEKPPMSQDSVPATQPKPGDPDGQTSRYTNALIHETSPYLLQHAHNPVNWYPWGKEAFEKAKREGKCIFLSIGYSTCYWCHVMERESFENEEVAAILNKHFVAIKVDREERPDVDEQYMLATQLITRRGGWPNSVWLMPDGRPWMAGTYFPRESFKQILLRLAGFWDTRREDVEAQAEQLAQAIGQIGSGQSELGDDNIDQTLVDRAVQELAGSFDERHGGFGGSPKFPPHASLMLLVHEYRRTQQSNVLRMIDGTLGAMAQGGVRDHIGGGFHRYSTDRQWLLPHFEKMLYDNAQLMRLYADGYLLTNDARYRQVVDDIFAWLQQEMTSPEGAFYSAIDSESEGEDGRFYLWDYDEISKELGVEDGTVFATTYGLQQDGNFTEEATGKRTGANIAFLPQRIDEVARAQSIDITAFRARLGAMRVTLLTVRNRRPRPHRDDKVLAGWNGLMISALAYAGRHLEEPKFVSAATRAAEFVLTSMTDDLGRLLRSYRVGEAKLPAYLDDYAYLADACLELHAATGDDRWVVHAQRLSDMLLDEFQDNQRGGFFFTSTRHDELLMRSKNTLGGGNIPSGNGVAAQVLLRLGHISNDLKYSRAAHRTLKSLAGVMRKSPHGSESLLLATAMHLQQADQRRSAAATKPTVRSNESDLHHEMHPITVDLFASRLVLTPGGTSRIAVSLNIAEGWHLYGPNPTAKFATQTTVRLKPNDAFLAGPVIVPPGVKTKDPVLDEPLNVYQGTVWFQLDVTVSKQAELGETTLDLELRTQACDNARCLPSETTLVRLPVSVSDSAPADNIRHSELFGSMSEAK